MSARVVESLALRKISRVLPFFLFLMGFGISGIADAACDYETLQGDWLLQGSGQSDIYGAQCIAAARLSIQSGGQARFQDIQISCQDESGNLPPGSQIGGRYLVKSGCYGEMRFFNTYFVAVDGGRQLLMTSARGQLTLSWTGSRVSGIGQAVGSVTQ